MSIPRNVLPALAALPALLGTAGCTRILTRAAGQVLGGDAALFAQEDDPELVRQALPFGLKTLEGLLARSPEDPRLLLSAASGFTQYAYGFVQQDAEFLAAKDPVASREGVARARRLYQRARDYGLRGLEARHPGFRDGLFRDPASAVAALPAQELPLLYWTGAAWAAQIALSKDEIRSVGQLRQVEALMARALALDETWDFGALHEFYVAYEGSRSEAMGGSRKRAREHLDRALALSGGRKLGPLVAYAETVAVAAQDRQTFNELLDRVLAFDADQAPAFRLANLLAQSRARWLKSRAEDLFLAD